MSTRKKIFVPEKNLYCEHCYDQHMLEKHAPKQAWESYLVDRDRFFREETETSFYTL